jgi:ELWxxDGT repeat protein
MVFVSLVACASLVFAPLNISDANAVEVEPSLVKDIWPDSGYGLSHSDAPAEEMQGVFVGSTYFFRANDGIHGSELWKSDGTQAGTVLVKNIKSGSSSSHPKNLKAVGNTLYFSADDGTNGRELWKSDGTEAGTVMVKDIRTGSSGSLVEYNAGLESEDRPDTLCQCLAVGSTFFFAANDGANGRELWKSDGTSEGTVRVKDIQPGSSSGNPRNLAALGNTLYFSASSEDTGRELWKSDGTEGGTVLVKDIHPTSSSDPEYLTVLGSTLYFSADNGTNGSELWKSDGTEAGTVLVKNIRPSIDGDDAGSDIEYITAVGNTLYFGANDGTYGSELWKSDGTEAGTVLVKNIRPASSGIDQGSGPEYLTAIGNTLYFSAYKEDTERELWKSNGTEAGTVMVKNIYPDTVGSISPSTPKYLTVVGNTLYFSANDGTHGSELWKSDGTEAGTVMVEDIWSGSSSGRPMHLSASASTLFFRADDGTVGVELWKLTIASVTDSPPPTSSGSVYVAPVVVPQVVPTTIRQPTIRKATNTKPARLLGKSLNKDVLFVADSARLSPEARKSLRQAARLAKASDGKVAVTGFAAMTNRGSAYEKSVALKRARVVARFLRSQGFDDWIYFHGLSGRQGQAFEGDPRRVEIRILK